MERTTGYETFHPDGRATITRRSDMTGNISKMEIPKLTYTQYSKWLDGALIQDAMPHLDAEQREFIMTGVTPEEWNAAFGNDE